MLRPGTKFSARNPSCNGLCGETSIAFRASSNCPEALRAQAPRHEARSMARALCKTIVKRHDQIDRINASDFCKGGRKKAGKK
jgi:hypothetical protein